MHTNHLENPFSVGDLVKVNYRLKYLADSKWSGMKGVVVKVGAAGPWPMAWVQWENGRFQSFETLNLALVEERSQ